MERGECFVACNQSKTKNSKTKRVAGDFIETSTEIEFEVEIPSMVKTEHSLLLMQFKFSHFSISTNLKLLLVNSNLLIE